MAKRNRETEMTVKTLDYHRNGVCGRGFYVGIVKFTEDGVTRDMLVVRFPNDTDGEPSSVASDDNGILCAAFDIAQLPDIEFAHGNSWRGDHFSDVMDKAIAAQNAARDAEMAVLMADKTDCC